MGGRSSYCWVRAPRFQGKERLHDPQQPSQNKPRRLSERPRHPMRHETCHSKVPPDTWMSPGWHTPGRGLDVGAVSAVVSGTPSSPPAGLQPHTAALRAMAAWRIILSTGPLGPDMWPQKDNLLLKRPNKENSEYLYVMAQVHLTTDVKVCCSGRQPQKCPQNTLGSLGGLYESRMLFFFWLFFPPASIFVISILP